MTHFLPGGPCVACFKEIDVVSPYSVRLHSLNQEQCSEFMMLPQMPRRPPAWLYTLFRSGTRTPFSEEIQHPIAAEPSWISLSADLFRLAVKARILALLSTIL